MTEDEVLEALGHLVGATDGWSAATVSEYTAQLLELDDFVALKQACIAIARSWSELRRPPLPLILEGYDRECSFRTKQIEPRRRHCDGHGWVPYTGDPTVMVPCPRCNPALAKVYADVDKRRRYEDGVGIENLDVGVEKVNGRLRWRDGQRPPRCYPADDPVEDVPSFDVGLDLAWRGYADERKGQKRKPTRRHFDKLIGRIG